jgi:signal transduction histidine kinase
MSAWWRAAVAAARRWRRPAEARRLLDVALAGIDRGVFVIDALRPGRPNLYVNPAYAALTGYADTVAVSDGFDALAIFVDPPAIPALDRGPASAAGSRVSVRRRDGTVFPAALTLRVVPRTDGRRYVIGLIDDLTTEHTEAHGAAAAAAPGASAQAAEFLASLSHELRSPLNACVMWLDVLTLSAQPDKLTKAVDALRRNLARQARVINDLVDAAKIFSGELEVHCEPIDLTALLERNLDTWQLLALSKQLTFQHSIGPTSARVNADPDRLLELFNQLLENAISSTATGGCVELTARCAHGLCVVEIADTGLGLSAEEATNVFTPLWRAPAAMKTRPGIGLGLAVAHHLAVKHGGTLTVASRDVGVAFTLSLPLAASGVRDAHGNALSNAAPER